MTHVIYPIFQSEYDKSIFIYIPHYQEAAERLRRHLEGVQQVTRMYNFEWYNAVHLQDVLEGVLEPLGDVERNKKYCYRTRLEKLGI